MPSSPRAQGRKPGQLRPIRLEPGLSRHAEGACLVRFGETVVHCTATVEERTPPFLRDTGKGWITAEYGMLPRSTHERMQREAAKGKQSGRTQEIQRLIGRSLRSVVDLKGLGERQVVVDCDVLQADGGTRTAAITGGFAALYLALQGMRARRQIQYLPVREFVAAVSCGIVKETPLLDLDYEEDSGCQADVNFVLTEAGGIVEIQGTAESHPFSEGEFHALLGLAKAGVAELIAAQKAFLGIADADTRQKTGTGDA